MGFRFRRVDTAERARPLGAALLLILPLSLALCPPVARAGADDAARDDDADAGVEEPAVPPAADSSRAQPDTAAPHSAPTVPVRRVGAVTVTATRAERDVLDVAGNVTVIDRAAIERSGARNLPELLRGQPGLFVTNTTGSLVGYTIDARGFNNGGGNGTNMLVLVDGRRVNEPDSDFADWALLPLDEVESLEIVRGPVSALYGDSAVGGVVNVRTRPREGPPRATLRGYGGGWGTGGGNLTAAGSVGAFTGGMFLDGVSSDGYRRQSAFSAQSYRGSAEWNFGDRVVVGARGGWHHDEREFPGALSQADIDMFGRRAQNPDNTGDRGTVESGYAAGWLEALLADGVHLSLEPHYRPRTDTARFTSLAFGDTLVDSDKTSAGIDAQIRVDRPLFGLENRLIVGGEFLYDARDSASTSVDTFGQCSAPTYTTYTDSRRNLYAGFVQNEVWLRKDVLLSAGVRVDQAQLDVRAHDPDPVCGGAAHERPDYRVWSPRASLTWRPLESLAFYASYARGFRIPSLDEASPLVFPGFVSLPDLDAQTSDSGEGGVKFHDDRVDARLALYYMMVNHEILFDPVFFTNQNLDRVRHFGIETSIEVQVVSWLAAYATYTFDDVRIVRADTPDLDGATMPITPESRGTAGLVFSLPWRLEMRANADFVGERILANDFGQAGGHLDPLPAYATLDLLFAWRPELSEHLRGAVTFALRNVNDEKFDGFGVRFGATPYFYPAATRSYEIGVSITVQR